MWKIEKSLYYLIVSKSVYVVEKKVQGVESLVLIEREKSFVPLMSN